LVGDTYAHLGEMSTTRDISHSALDFATWG
jgi:hypothetical protein